MTSKSVDELKAEWYKAMDAAEAAEAAGVAAKIATDAVLLEATAAWKTEKSAWVAYRNASYQAALKKEQEQL